MSAENILNPDTTGLIDPLTGLASRTGLESYLKRVEASGATGPLSILTMELSRFGNVNDSMGADLGNKIISSVAKRLQKIFQNAALIARTHGDHFCLVLEGSVEINEQIELLNDFAQRPLALRGEIIVLSVRVGVAVLGPLVESPSLLLHAAEIALHRAKRDLIKRCFYHRELESEAKASHRLENDLRVSLVTNHAELHKAINNDEFRILYQPIVDTMTKQVHAMEALIRWHHPKRGVISPAQFIPMAEQIQVMDVLGSWILRRACLDAKSFASNADGSQPGVSINVSATQFLEPGVLFHSVKKALNESGIEPNLVKLEITESTSLGVDKIAIIDSLRSLGCMIALDDFGTGYSSLTQLNLLPLDYIKLDQSFITAIGGADEVNSSRSNRMTRAVLSIANAFDLIPIIEGVETELQRELLEQNDANLMQGYLFAKPLTLKDANEFILQFNNTTA
jgi:diguanylate cyclase (GGDEF)-like protein